MALLLAALLGAPALASTTYLDGIIPFESEHTPPAGLFEGEVSAAPAFQWKTRLPGPPMNSATHSEYTRPVVHGDALYVGSAAGRALYQLSRRDGTLLQTYPAASSVESAPAIYKERVYFADTGGSVWCYALDGELMWTREGNAPILVQPTLRDGVLYITNVDDLAIALNSKTGDLLWRYQAKADLTREAELTLYAAPPAVVVDDDVLVGFSDGSLVALDRASGEVSWQRQVGEGRYPDLVAKPVQKGSDLVSSGYFQPLVALDLPSRTVRWRLDAGSAGAALIDDSVGKDVVYHPGSDGKLRAVSLLTGAENWVWDSGVSGSLTTPLITPAGLFIGSSDRSLYMLELETGEELWRFHEDFILGGVSSGPVAAGRQLFFVSNAGNLYAMIAPKTPSPRRPAWP